MTKRDAESVPSQMDAIITPHGKMSKSPMHNGPSNDRADVAICRGELAFSFRILVPNLSRRTGSVFTTESNPVLES